MFHTCMLSERNKTPIMAIGFQRVHLQRFMIALSYIYSRFYVNPLTTCPDYIRCFHFLLAN